MLPDRDVRDRRLLAASDEARQYVEEIRQTARGSRRSLRKEAGALPILSLANHRAIDQTIQQTAREPESPLVEEPTGPLGGRLGPGPLLRQRRLHQMGFTKADLAESPATTAHSQAVVRAESSAEHGHARAVRPGPTLASPGRHDGLDRKAS